MRIVGLVGSLRKGSYNRALLEAASSLAPTGSEVSVRGLEGIPVYNGDVEASEGLPVAVRDLKDAIAASSGLIIATPEYNSSIPGPLKNAIDWCSRPVTDIDRVFGGRPVALCGASPGRFGTLLSQAAWLPVFRQLGLRYWPPGQLLVSGAHESFSEDGSLADDRLKTRLEKFVSGFSDFCAKG